MTSGKIVGYYDGADGHTHGFLLVGGMFITIDIPGAPNTLVRGINRNGDLVGSYSTHGFLLKDGVLHTLDFPEAAFTEAWNVNSFDQIVGLYAFADGVIHGFLLREGHYVKIDFPQSVYTIADDINDFGLIAGDYRDVNVPPPPPPTRLTCSDATNLPAQGMQRLGPRRIARHAAEFPQPPRYLPNRREANYGFH